MHLAGNRVCVNSLWRAPKYCDAIAAIPLIARYFVREVNSSRNGAMPPLVLSFTQAHRCNTQFCNISRDNCALPQEFCDTIATSIARYEKYHCWASKSESLLMVVSKTVVWVRSGAEWHWISDSESRSEQFRIVRFKSCDSQVTLRTDRMRFGCWFWIDFPPFYFRLESFFGVSLRNFWRFQTSDSGNRAIRNAAILCRWGLESKFRAPQLTIRHKITIKERQIMHLIGAQPVLESYDVFLIFLGILLWRLQGESPKTCVITILEGRERGGTTGKPEHPPKKCHIAKL